MFYIKELVEMMYDMRGDDMTSKVISFVVFFPIGRSTQEVILGPQCNR